MLTSESVEDSPPSSDWLHKLWTWCIPVQQGAFHHGWEEPPGHVCFGLPRGTTQYSKDELIPTVTTQMPTAQALVLKPTIMIFPVLPTVRPEFRKPELMATECWKRDKILAQRTTAYILVGNFIRVVLTLVFSRFFHIFAFYQSALQKFWKDSLFSNGLKQQ